jgi:hypothetical protein
MAGFGRAPIAAAADIGSAKRGNFRERDELTDDADLGLPTFGERMGGHCIREGDGSRGVRGGAEKICFGRYWTLVRSDVTVRASPSM